jgi:hypothetical protein
MHDSFRDFHDSEQIDISTNDCRIHTDHVGITRNIPSAQGGSFVEPGMNVSRRPISTRELETTTTTRTDRSPARPTREENMRRFARITASAPGILHLLYQDAEMPDPFLAFEGKYRKSKMASFKTFLMRRIQAGCCLAIHSRIGTSHLYQQGQRPATVRISRY